MGELVHAKDQVGTRCPERLLAAAQRSEIMGQGSGCLLDHLWHCDLGVLLKGIHHEPVAPDVVHALRVGAKHQRPLSNSGEALLWAGDLGLCPGQETDGDWILVGVRGLGQHPALL